MALNFNRLQTPPHDGDTLIEPPPRQWEQLLEANLRHQHRQGKPPLLAGIPIEVERQAVRLRLMGPSFTGRILAVGHQPEFIHPGVWAKHVVAHQMAHQLAAAGLDLVVDQDSPREPELKVPRGSPDVGFDVQRVPFSTIPTGSVHEYRPALSHQELDRITNELSAALGERLMDSMLPTYLAGLRECTGPDFVAQHLHAREKIDMPLQANLRERRVSEVFGGHFLADLLLNAERFATAYNRALEEYRHALQIRGNQQPLPNLHRADDRQETALWAYQPREQRRRLWISRDRDALVFHADRIPIGTLSTKELQSNPDAALAELRPWVIRPRALTLMLWARWLASDLFVHGIGGAKYDRITDTIFHHYCGCPAPVYACVTATLRLPLPSHPVTPADLTITQRRLRDLIYNPQRYVPNASADLIDQRQKLIRMSEALRQQQTHSPQRRQVYLDIHEANRLLRDSDSQLQYNLRERLTQLRRQLTDNQVSASREYFYALQPQQRLRELAAKLIRATR